jgi:hypothetical protein
MSRFQGAAALVAAAVLIASAGTALAQTTQLSPTPPVPLPQHAPPSHKPPSPPAKTLLPKTGMAVLPELLAATVLVAAGISIRDRISGRWSL